MGKYEIIEGRPYHCGQIIRRLREDHQQAVAWLGVNSHREIRGKFDASTYRRGWTINGRLAGLGGVVGTAISAEGMIWMALSSEASRHPIAVTKMVKCLLAEVMVTKRVVYTTILKADAPSWRFAQFLGFEESGRFIPAFENTVVMEYKRQVPSIRMTSDLIGDGQWLN